MTVGFDLVRLDMMRAIACVLRCGHCASVIYDVLGFNFVARSKHRTTRIDNVVRRCGSTLLKLRSVLNIDAGPNQSVKRSGMMSVPVLVNNNSALLPLCYNPGRRDHRGSTKYTAFAQRNPSIPILTLHVIR